MQPSRWRCRFLLRGGLASAVVGVMVAAGVWYGHESADLTVLCPNEENVCHRLADEYEDRSGATVSIVRLPTHEALTRLRVQAGSPEFDVWMGGPAEAYPPATDDHLLADLSDIDVSGVDPRFRASTWVGIYGGVLGMCVRDDLENPPQTWEDLRSTDARVVMSLPLSSGTAATFLAVHDERLGQDVLDYLHDVDRHVVTYSESGTSPAELVGRNWADVVITFLRYCDDQRQRGRRVHSVIPADGTGFEVGAAALIAGSDNPHAREFLAFIASAEGQELASSVRGQLPVTIWSPHSLREELGHVSCVYGLDIDRRDGDST